MQIQIVPSRGEYLRMKYRDRLVQLAHELYELESIALFVQGEMAIDDLHEAYTVCLQEFILIKYVLDGTWKKRLGA